MSDQPRRMLVSFSGGETSAYMLWYIFNHMKNEYDEIVVVFANTGEENEETLEFVQFVSMLFSIPVVWIEAVIYHGERKSPGFKIVDFETAARKGEPFEEAIKKYGIPNSKFKDCTRNLKLRPIEAYAASLGWKKGAYDTAIGIRADEIDRLSSEAPKRRLVYPLVKRHPMTKPKINFWWSQQPFRLNLKGYQGNCRWCWKKSRRKHLTLMQETPGVFDFPERMERDYALVGPEFQHDPTTRANPLPDGYRRTFFRGNQSVADIRAELTARRGAFVPAHDDAIVFDPDLDVGGACEESCEVYADEDDGDGE